MVVPPATLKLRPGHLEDGNAYLDVPTLVLDP